MTEKAQKSSARPFDLEERTFLFAKECRNFLKRLKKDTINIEYIKQLTRSSGSQAANYIEANKSLSKKDFVHRIKICRKETKESCLWLKLLDIEDCDLENTRNSMLQEATELRKIFIKILEKTQ